MTLKRHAFAFLLAVAASFVLLGCPGGKAPESAPAQQAAAPAPAASAPASPAPDAAAPESPTPAGTAPEAAPTVEPDRAESPSAGASGAITISSVTYERTGSGGRVTLGSTQQVPPGNNGQHDFQRAVDACAAAALASDCQPSLVWFVFSTSASDQISLKLDGVTCTVSGTIANPRLVEVSGSGSASKVCVTGSIGGTPLNPPACITTNATNAASLTRWLSAASGATSVTAGLDPGRCELRITTASSVTSAELLFSLKP